MHPVVWYRLTDISEDAASQKTSYLTILKLQQYGSTVFQWCHGRDESLWNKRQEHLEYLALIEIRFCVM